MVKYLNWLETNNKYTIIRRSNCHHTQWPFANMTPIFVCRYCRKLRILNKKMETLQLLHKLKFWTIYTSSNYQETRKGGNQLVKCQENKECVRTFPSQVQRFFSRTLLWYKVQHCSAKRELSFDWSKKVVSGWLLLVLSEAITIEYSIDGFTHFEKHIMDNSGCCPPNPSIYWDQTIKSFTTTLTLGCVELDQLVTTIGMNV